MKRELNSNKGITLVALVVTIIVLLILAGITINIAIDNGGIIQRAKDAKAHYENSAVNEQGTLNIISDTINELINDNNSGTVTVEIGYYEIGTQVTIVEPSGTTWQDIISNSEYGLSTNSGRVVWHGKILNGVSLSDALIDGSRYMFAVAECVFPDSEIINNLDGKVTLAKDIKVNDNVVYYNFKNNKIEIGSVAEVFVHKKATQFVKYTFEDGSYLKVTDYHPIYTKNGWKSYTNRNGYEKPIVGDYVKTESGWKQLVNIEEETGEEDCYDFAIVSTKGDRIDNYFANGTLVQSSL